jgi:hypothetical protein
MNEPSLSPNAGLLAQLALSPAHTTDPLQPQIRCDPLRFATSKTQTQQATNTWHNATAEFVSNVTEIIAKT